MLRASVSVYSTPLVHDIHLLDELRNDLLRMPSAVCVGGVNCRHAAIPRRLEDLDRLCNPPLRSQLQGLNAADLLLFHDPWLRS